MLSLVALTCGLVGQTPSPSLEIKLYGDVIARHFEEALFGTRMTLRSDAVDREGNLVKGGQVRFGEALGGKAFAFSIPRHSVDLGWFGSVTYRLATIELEKWSIRQDDRDFIVETTFRGTGPQFIGSHSAFGRNVVPDVYLDRMKMSVRLRPSIMPNGSPSYSDPRVTFQAKMRSEALTFTAFGHEVDLLDAVTGYRDRMAAIVCDRVRACLAARERREAFGRFLLKAMNERAAELNMRLGSMRFSGTTLQVRLALPQ